VRAAEWKLYGSSGDPHVAEVQRGGPAALMPTRRATRASNAENSNALASFALVLKEFHYPSLAAGRRGEGLRRCEDSGIGAWDDVANLDYFRLAEGHGDFREGRHEGSI
jgi:hypothetical protein